jgi:hypothetical protein
MKSFNVLHILLFLLLMLVYQCAKAQDVLVTHQGDTIKGAIKIMAFGASTEVRVTTPDKKKSNYNAFKIKYFSLDGVKYKPVSVPSEGIKFMQVIEEGYLSLLAFQAENQTSYDAQYLLKRDGNGMEVPNLTFKKGMSKFLADCENVKQKIDAGDLAKKDIVQIVKDYNGCVDDRTKSQSVAAESFVEQTKKISALDKLETSVINKPDFEGKADALEMIADVKGKIKRGEKIPKFIQDGLRNSLDRAELHSELDNAMKEINSQL